MIRHLVFAAFFICSSVSFAQDAVSAKNKSPFPVKYRSIADQNILLKTITLAPVYDNQNGIYAQPIQKLLVDLLQSDKAWGYAEIVGHDKNKFIENYDLNPNDVIEVLTKSKAQGLLTAFITKGPRGISAKLKLFGQSDGIILVEESVEEFNGFELSKLRLAFAQMYQNLKNKLPYRGYVLSRRGQDVTVSLGEINGVKVGQELTLAQIIKLNRHPKLKTLVGVEKEIIAKVSVKKVDTYLSFCQIIFEKETGVVDVGAKVLPEQNLTYPTPQLNADGVVVGETRTGESQAKNDNQLPTIEKYRAADPNDAETERHRDALFDRHNTDGKIIAQAVITQYGETNSLAGGVDSTSKQGFAPGVLLGGQYYVYGDFFVGGSYYTSSFTVPNGIVGSTPDNLSVALTQTKVMGGYDYVYDGDEDSDSLKFTGLIGFNNLKVNIDNSNPVALTSTETTAAFAGIEASMRFAQEIPLSIGGRFELSFSPSVTESPVNSGSSSTSTSAFGFFGIYQLNDKYNLRFDLNIYNINNHFSGAGTRTNPAGSGKLQLTTEQVGIEYLF